MTGNEKFIFDDKELDFGILDFWKYKYSDSTTFLIFSIK